MNVTFDLGSAPIIDDSNWRSHVVPVNGPDGPAYIARDYDLNPVGSLPGGRTLPAHMRYDEKQLREIFTEQEAKKTSLKHMIDRLGFKGWLNQNPTNYCWCYAVVHALMIVRFLAGLPLERLSPFSVACFIKNFRNIGGWGTQALSYIVQHGCASEEFWPAEKPDMTSSQRQAANMNAIRNGRQYAESSRADAATRKIDEYYDVGDRDWLGKLSLLAHRIPVPSGYSYMGHEMCSIRGIVMPNGELACEDMDHYGGGGNYNSKILVGRRGIADDACAPVVSAPKFNQ